jgi:2Fe-2S ferredoxin
MLELKNTQEQKQIDAEVGWSILDLALKHQVEWGFSCTRGTCARCRCFVVHGMECLEETTDAEISRLDQAEIEKGYRLACQCIIKHAGEISIVYKPYF